MRLEEKESLEEDEGDVETDVDDVERTEAVEDVSVEQLGQMKGVLDHATRSKSCSRHTRGDADELIGVENN